MLASIATILSFFSGDNPMWKYLPWILVLVLSAVALGGIKSCSDARENVKTLRNSNTRTLKNLKDKNQEALYIAQTRAQKQEALTKDMLKTLDSLSIKVNGLQSIKTIEVQKTVYDTVHQYDTIYKMLEGTDIPKTFTRTPDSCITINGEFTPQGLQLKVKRNIKITDYSYYKRRDLWGVKALPKWGRKEFYQTLTTNCGDTVKNNQKIVFGKE